MKILKRIVREFAKFVMRIYCKIVYRYKIIGKENIPKEGAVIFCANHRSYLDPPLVEITCKRDDTRFLAKRDLVKNKMFAFLGNAFNVILVDRDSRDVKALKDSVKTLKNGNAIALFPEGTRNGIEKGESAKGGASYFALNTDSVVVPIGIKGGKKPFQKVIITYGKPIDYSEYKEKRKEKETIEYVTNSIMENIIELTK